MDRDRKRIDSSAGSIGGGPDATPQAQAQAQAQPQAQAQDEARFLERTKELDFAHRSHLYGVARAILSLGFLRRACRRLWTPTASPPTAGSVPHPAPGALGLTFVGHGTVMITTPAARLLTDPILENSLCGLRRVRGAAIAPEDLNDVSLVLISHAHRDHLSRPTLRRLPRTATVVVPSRCGSLLADLGFARVVELGIGQSFAFGDVEVITVPARHSGTRGLLDRGRRGNSGYVVRTQGRTIYFAGDTGYFSGFSEIGQRFSPDLALLPISGYQPAPFRREHLSPLDALYAFEDLGARILVPICYGSFELAYEPIAEPIDWLRALGEERQLGQALTILAHGQTCLLR